MELFPLDRSHIAAIVQRCGLGEIKSLNRMETGFVNPCFQINGDYFLRLNTRDPERKKFRQEVAAYDRLRKEGISVPEVLLCDESGTLVPFGFLVTRKIPGETISRYWPTLTRTEQTALARSAGVLLARMHAISVDFFGDFIDESRRRPQWSEFLASELPQHLKAAEGCFDAKNLQQVSDLFSRMLPLLQDVSTASLLHGDFHWGNLIGSGTQINGVIDLEHSFAGDAEVDLRMPENMEDSGAQSWEPFLAGYRSQRPSSAGSSLKDAFYQLLYRLELAPIVEKHWRGKVSWGDRVHADLHRTFHQKLAFLIRELGPLQAN